MSATVEFDAVDDRSASVRNCSHSESDDDVRRYDVRQRLSREEKRAEFEELVRTGQVRVRTVDSPDEAQKYGIDLERLRLRREQAEMPRQDGPGKRHCVPPDAEMAAKLRAAHDAELAKLRRLRYKDGAARDRVRAELDGLLAEAFLTSTARQIAAVVGVAESTVRTRLAAERRRREEAA